MKMKKIVKKIINLIVDFIFEENYYNKDYYDFRYL